MARIRSAFFSGCGKTYRKARDAERSGWFEAAGILHSPGAEFACHGGCAVACRLTPVGRRVPEFSCRLYTGEIAHSTARTPHQGSNCMKLRVTLAAVGAVAMIGAAQAAETTSTATAGGSTAAAKAATTTGTAESKTVKLPSGTSYEDLVVGTGKEATKGSDATVHYVGTLQNGTKFDSSRDRNEPFTVENLGNAPVIKGWNEGLVGMKVGGKRKLTIPPEAGYGARGAGGVIPPNATLIFEVELLDVK